MRRSTTARLGGHDNICELLAPLMEETKRRRSVTQTFGHGPELHNFDVR